MTEFCLGKYELEVVIILPADFNEAQRHATRITGRKEGLSVKRFINELSVVAWSLGMNYKMEKLDFGFTKRLGPFYALGVKDAFSTVPSAHASIEEVAKLMNFVIADFLIQKNLTNGEGHLLLLQGVQRGNSLLLLPTDMVAIVMSAADVNSRMEFMVLQNPNSAPQGARGVSDPDLPSALDFYYSEYTGCIYATLEIIPMMLSRTLNDDLACTIQPINLPNRIERDQLQDLLQILQPASNTCLVDLMQDKICPKSIKGEDFGRKREDPLNKEIREERGETTDGSGEENKVVLFWWQVRWQYIAYLKSSDEVSDVGGVQLLVPTLAEHRG
ncbi:hypothetical protein ACLOJK_019599 [Asimina triloba]